MLTYQINNSQHFIKKDPDEIWKFSKYNFPFSEDYKLLYMPKRPQTTKTQHQKI